MASLSGQKKNLLVFDFDHSLVDSNTDVDVVKLAPGGKIPPEVKVYKDKGWTHYMGQVFRYLHDNGVTQENILDCMSETKFTHGMEQLLSFTSSQGKEFDHIIISDSNSVFINHILKCKDMSSLFLQVFTNPAAFEENGLLTLKAYHHQDWCSLSSKNMCKGHILKKFIEERKQETVTYSHIYYVGDGFNDLCPGLTLGPEDFLLPRVNYRLISALDEIWENGTPVPKSSLKAQVIPWKSGLDILKHLQS